MRNALLHHVEVQVPPLRARRDDIPLLVDFFLGRFMAKRASRTGQPANGARNGNGNGNGHGSNGNGHGNGNGHAHGDGHGHGGGTAIAPSHHE